MVTPELYLAELMKDNPDSVTPDKLQILEQKFPGIADKALSLSASSQLDVAKGQENRYNYDPNISFRENPADSSMWSQRADAAHQEAVQAGAYKTPLEQTQQAAVKDSMAKKPSTDVPWWISEAPRFVGGVAGGLLGRGNPVAIGAGAAVGEAGSDVVQNLFYGEDKNLIADPLIAGGIDTATSALAPPILNTAGKIVHKIPVVGPALKWAGDKGTEAIGGVIKGATQPFLNQKPATELSKYADDVINNIAPDADLGDDLLNSLNQAKKEAKQAATGLYDQIDDQIKNARGGEAFETAENYVQTLLDEKTKLASNRASELLKDTKIALGKLADDIEQNGEQFTFQQLRETRKGVNAAIKDSVDKFGNATPLTAVLENIKGALEKDLKGLAKKAGDTVYHNYKVANEFYKLEVIPKKQQFAAGIRKLIENKPEMLSKTYAKTPAQLDKLKNILSVKNVGSTPKPLPGSINTDKALDPIRLQQKRDLFEGIKKTDPMNPDNYELDPVGFLDRLRSGGFKRSFIELHGQKEFSRLEKLGVQAQKEILAYKQATTEAAKTTAQQKGMQVLNEIEKWFGFGVGEATQFPPQNQGEVPNQ